MVECLPWRSSGVAKQFLHVAGVIGVNPQSSITSKEVLAKDRMSFPYRPSALAISRSSMRRGKRMYKASKPSWQAL